MAITPLDLQTLFAQIDKIGKDIAAQKDGASLHETIMNSIAQQKAQEKTHTVIETEDSGEGPGKLRSQQSWQKKGGEGREDNEGEGGRKSGRGKSPVSDPNLGNYVDISG